MRAWVVAAFVLAGCLSPAPEEPTGPGNGLPGIICDSPCGLEIDPSLAGSGAYDISTASNPADSNHIVIAISTNEGCGGLPNDRCMPDTFLRVYVTHDGGRTFSVGKLPTASPGHASYVLGGTYDAAFAGNTVLVAGLRVSRDDPAATGLVVFRSQNGGATFDEAVSVLPYTPSVIAPRVALAGTPDGAALLTFFDYLVPIPVTSPYHLWETRSSDAGATWTPPEVAYENLAANYGWLDATPSLDGWVLSFWVDYSLQVLRSDGETWLESPRLEGVKPPFDMHVAPEGSLAGVIYSREDETVNLVREEGTRWNKSMLVETAWCPDPGYCYPTGIMPTPTGTWVAAGSMAADTPPRLLFLGTEGTLVHDIGPLLDAGSDPCCMNSWGMEFTREGVLLIHSALAKEGAPNDVRLFASHFTAGDHAL